MIMECKRHFSKETLTNALTYFDAISFSQKDDSDEGKSFIIESGEGDRFTLRRIANERFEILNNSPAGHNLYVDSFEIPPGHSLPIEQKSVFIYDKAFSEASQDGPAFIYGFDPCQPEMWQLSPRDRGCSVSASRFTRKFKIGEDQYVGIEDVSFEIRPAEFVGIYGNSGTGKTVLIESLIAPRQRGTKFFHRSRSEMIDGSLLIDKKQPKLLSESIAYLPQHIHFPKRIKCRELLKLGLADRRNASSYSIKFIEETLRLCALSSDVLNEKYGKLSGGQQRRLALAVALLNNKIRLFIADEPTSGLDIASEMEVMRTFRKLSRHRGITVVVVTHAVAALKMFDRVMALRKHTGAKGASLSFNSLWCEEAFPPLFTSSITQDAERIAFLSNQASAMQLPRCKMNQYVWPFCFGEYLKAPEKSLRSQCIKLILAPLQWLKDTCSRHVFWQYIGWSKNTLRLICREYKSLFVFLLLAFCCVLSIQLGAGNGVSGSENLVTLMSLCAPWLCATYATVFVSELLPIFAWENFSGLRARGFTLGILSGLLLPCALISLVFAVGLFWRFDTAWLGKNIYHGLKASRCERVVSFFISPDKQKEYEEFIQEDYWQLITLQ